jgi:hypothetical protein
LFALRRHLQLALLLAGLLALSTAAYGSGVFHAPAPRAGGPADAPSGYTVTNVAYTLSAGDPHRIARVTFALLAQGSLAPGAMVQAKLIRSSSSYSTCANIPSGSTTWDCPIGGVTVAEADQLAVRVGPTPDAGHRLWLPIIKLPGEQG